MTQQDAAPNAARIPPTESSAAPSIRFCAGVTAARGGAVIYGRSDSTLNRGGVRMGTSEFYRVVETLPEVADSLVVDTSSLGGDVVGKLWLFVVPAPGITLSGELVRRILRVESNEHDQSIDLRDRDGAQTREEVRELAGTAS